jgi:hypothetical protein
VRHLVFKLRFIGLVAFGLVGAMWPIAAQAATNPTLGNAASFAVLAGTAASCTTSSITGGVGVNFTPPITAGCHAQYAPGAFSAFQKVLLGTKPACGTTIGTTFPDATINLGPGTYCNGTTGLTFTDQTLNLTGTGSWNFEIGAGFTGTNLNVVMADGGNPCNVFWWIGADATLTVNKPVKAPFQGTILGAGAITLTGSASDTTALTLTGHVWATTAVTITNSTIIGCNAAGTVGCGKTKGGDGNEDGAQSSESADKDGNKACKPPKQHCNQGVGNGPEGCDPGNSNQGDDSRSNDELGGTPGDPGRQGGNAKQNSAMTASISLETSAAVAVVAKSDSHSSARANVAVAATSTSHRASSVSDNAKGKSDLHANGKSKGKSK